MKMRDMKDMTRVGSERSIPSILPPPYTSTGARVQSLRKTSTSFTTTSELLVGPKHIRFLLHTHLLTSQSPYFRASLTGSFFESTTQSITLADVNVETFELLVLWLYQGCLSPPPMKDGKPAYYSLLNLWILADRLCFEGLRNYIIDLMSDLADSTNSVLTPSDTRILYEQISEESKIKELVLDLFAFKKTDKLLATHTDRWHAGFLRDLVVRLKKPCEQAMQRHNLHMWCPNTWHVTRACDSCRQVLPPRYGAVACDECGVVFCALCTQDDVGMASWEDGRQNAPLLVPMGDTFSNGGGADQLRYGEGERVAKMARCNGKARPVKFESCKPWRGSRCRIYHEHSETDSCGDVMMGR
ncbi:hypothetical protein P280DRAFT_425965 [Massarina eburnea CBS 473.64]|uniref:BTB domain-containing protein n=1 Tax=Massarina eburnea CBS 473.64 TaxID=1395130 RepID=A0A6A6S0S4_9PLEO|nr:hypothetical protein P280DRAFT_425965 [Massarina eburnea CBS 473.64]